MNRVRTTALLLALLFASWSGAQETVPPEGLEAVPAEALATITASEGSATVIPEDD